MKSTNHRAYTVKRQYRRYAYKATTKGPIPEAYSRIWIGRQAISAGTLIPQYSTLCYRALNFLTGGDIGAIGISPTYYRS